MIDTHGSDCRVFLCYRDNGAETAKLFYDSLKGINDSDYGKIWFSDYEGRGNYVLDIKRLLSSAEFAVLFIAENFTKGFLKDDGTINISNDQTDECVTVREIIEIERQRQMNNLEVLCVNIDGSKFDEHELIVLKQVFEKANIIQDDTLQFYKNLQLNTYNRRSTLMQDFIKARFSCLEIVSEKSVVNKEKLEKEYRINPLLRYSFPRMKTIGRKEVILDIVSKVENNNAVVILGKKHIGKTSVAYQVSKKLEDKFEYILYFDFEKDNISNALLSFCNAMSLLCGYSVSVDELDASIPPASSQKILFVFDNVEYGMDERVTRIIEAVYQVSSNNDVCARFVVITNRPENGFKKFNCLVYIPGIDEHDVEEMARIEQVEISQSQAKSMVDIYGGSPSYIQIAIEYCKSFCESSVELFLSMNSTVVGDINTLISEQYRKLSESEKNILMLITFLGEPASISLLRKYCNIQVNQFEMIISELYDKNFISEFANSKIKLFSPIEEYLVNYVIFTVASEIENACPILLKGYPLVSNLSTESARTHQREIIKRIIGTIKNKREMNNDEIANRLNKMLNDNRATNGYLVGNILNLLSEMYEVIDGWDFSGTTIIDASMESVELRNVNFSNSVLDRCAFKNIFGSVTALSYNRELEMFATGFFNGLIIVWDKDGQQRSVLMDFDNVINDIIFDGRYLWACGKDGRIIEWIIDEDLNFEIKNEFFFNGSSVRTITVPKTNAFVIAGSEDGKVIKWHTNELGEIDSKIICECDYRIKAVCLSSKGNLLAVAGDSDKVGVYDLNNGECIKVYNVNNRWIRCITFYDDSTLLCGGDSGNINIINIIQGDCSDIIGVDKNKIWTMSVLKGINCVVAGGNDGTLKIISLESKGIVGVLSKHTSWVRCLDSSDAYMYSGSEDQTICIWSIAEYECLKTIKGYTKRVFSMCNSNGKLYAGLGDHTVLDISDIFKGMPAKRVVQCSDQVWAVSSFGNLLCAGCDKGDVYIYDTQANRMLFTHHFSTGWIGSVCYSRNGSQLAIGDELGYIYIFNTRNKYLITQSNKKKVHNGRVAAMVFISYGILTVGEDGFVNCFDTQKSKSTINFRVCNNLLYTVCQVDDSLFLVGGADGKVYQISLLNQEVKVVFDTHLPIWSLKITKRNTVIVGLDNGMMREYSIIDGTVLNESYNHQNQIWAIEYLPESDVIISGGEDSQIIAYNNQFDIISVFTCNKPYENVIISGCKGLSTMQMNYLCAMGAIY